ncbi:MutS-related protein [Sediminibacterium soli]|uniref:MutS-related protein n=1 Tax=Sediminibacterium soli TaxID=2698829 RepID=UPI00137A2284|nr:DNA mismatch repair protein MutS [Sediminibacterium soli]NCI47501.1 DNA mismatch repair protein MutS [Sediminibacterium soli]
MQIDKTTLTDLSIFHSEEEQSVFNHLNFAQTNGGREHLHYLLGHPLDSVEAIEDTQKTIRCLMEIIDEWPAYISNGTVMMIEKFFDSHVNRYPHHPNKLDAKIFQLFNRHDYSLMRYSIVHVIDFTKGLNHIVQLLEGKTLSKDLSSWVTRISLMLAKPMIQRILQEDKHNLSAVNVLVYTGYVREGYKNAAFELISLYSTLDAYLGLAIACRNYQLAFPTVSRSAEPFLNARALYHPLLQTPVSYDVDLARDKNFLFLTGANMAGKSTFIKAVGIAAYLAHIGMGVPASGMELAFLDGMLSNIQVVDNIIKGESFFFNEVQRIRNTVEKISDGKNWLILIDELFKGTNQQDAIKCSVTVIEGLRKLKSALFVLSTHLYEIGQDLKQYPNLQFYYFETAVNNDQLEFSYHLKPGISNDRIGYLILKREGVVSLLEKL